MNQSFNYQDYTFKPYGNIIGKDEETRFQRLMSRINTIDPLLKTAEGYDYDEFNLVTDEAADIYFCLETERYYVPTSGGLCSVDVADLRKYIKIL